MNILVFDIETIPDIEGGQAIFDLKGLDDKSTAKAMKHIHQQKTGSDFLPLYLHKIIAISVLHRGMGDDMGKALSVKSLGDGSCTESDLLKLFFEEIDAKKPDLVSWNGSHFDFPVIRYRALKNMISLPDHWSEESDYYHHDVKYELSMYNPDATAPLDHIAKQLGYPGKMGMDGSQVWDEFQSGNLQGIRNYCETDVLNTYLVYLRYQLMCGESSRQTIEQEFTLLQDDLKLQAQNGQTHLEAFLKAW